MVLFLAFPYLRPISKPQKRLAAPSFGTPTYVTSLLALTPPNVSRPFFVLALVVGSKDTPRMVAGMRDWLARFWVTVLMPWATSGERVPTVRPKGPGRR